MRISSIVLAGLQLLGMVVALPKVTRTGKYLYNESGDRFFIKGVAYQPQGEMGMSSESNAANGGFPEPSTFHDPLSSPQNCTRDLPFLKQLGVNTLRVYSVNSSLNHDECMKALSNAGIYVLLDLSLPLNGSIDRSSPSWSTNLLDQYIATINAFKGYDNILGFNVGNEVINLATNTNAAPYVKAAARDIKAYLKSIGSSALVGYAAVDGEADFRNSLAKYMTCGGDDVAVDIYGLNNYEWCGNENINSSNWNGITEGFKDIPVAAYMSEYGCITNPPRLWTEVTALFASPVVDVFSGGVAFSYFPTSDGYGMVSISDDGKTITTSDDFRRLSSQYNSTSPPNSPAKSSSTAKTDCPAENASLLASSNLPPTPNEALQGQRGCCKLTSYSRYGCSLLGSTKSSASCNSIGGNGTSGTYGELSYCSPAIKLSYVFSVYYQLNPVDTSCDFGGNATLSQNRPNTPQDANAAGQSCLAAKPSGGVFTPTAPGAAASTGSGTSPATSGATSGGSSSHSAAIERWLINGFLMGIMGAMALIAGGSILV
nr:1,3-beta-glucanosyltransferase [Cryptococcus depauperatus CBS 7841]ODN92877.1 1,3-beta-glucanosyltransferase [Cryptococcus depauperatus CBS 7855]